MGQIVPTNVEQMDFGITNNIRVGDSRYCQMCKHFDIFTKKNALIPYRDSEDGNSGGDTDKQALFLQYSGKTFALAVVAASAKVRIMERSDFSGNTWTDTANGADSGGSRSEDCFVEYHGYAFGFAAGTRIWAADLSGSAAFTVTALSVSAYTTVAQGLVHSKDDILYLPYDNKIATNANGSYTAAALTLPAHLTIVSICEDGNYLSIACKPKNGVGKSITYLWDRDSSVTMLSESIDFGSGDLQIVEEIEGTLVGVSVVGSSTSAFVPKVVFREYTGGSGAEIIPHLTLTSTSAPLIKWKQKVNGKLYFGMVITMYGVIHEGIWVLGKNNSGQWCLALDRLPNNDTGLTSGQIKGFILVGDYMFIAYINNGSYGVSKTNDQASFTATSIYESIIFNLGDSDIKKKLIGFTSMFEPLLAAGKIKAYYKKDAETTWTRIFKFDTDNEISHGATTIEPGDEAFTVTVASPGVFTLAEHGLIAGQKVRLSTTGALPTGLTAGVEYYVISAGLTSSTFELSATSGGAAINTTGTQSGTHSINRKANLPEDKEIQYRIESLGGGVPTGYKFKQEVLDKALY